jgi:hypothetical protein
MNIHNPDALINEREKTHGHFNVAAPIMEALISVYESSPNWKRMTATQKQVFRMHAHKAGRILAGDCNYLDHWVDIEKYYRLEVIELTGERWTPGTPEDGGHHAQYQPEDEDEHSIVEELIAGTKIKAALDTLTPTPDRAWNPETRKLEPIRAFTAD